jgi:hypothetical protein
MRKRVLAIAALVGVTIVIGATLANSRSGTSLPGTGVKLVLPDRIVSAPFGTMYTDGSRETVFSIASGSVDKNLAKNATMRALYPDPVEAFHSATISGSLYKRTRSIDGGTWDGWWLNVVKGDHVLAVKISGGCANSPRASAPTDRCSCITCGSDQAHELEWIASRGD